MSYEQAIEAAGADVVAFKEFGSYQGDWWAKVRYNGVTGWINGSYGSCSGCDAFQAEFDYGSGEACSEHEYVYPKPDGCEACAAAKGDYRRRLADFGRGYLDALQSQEDAEASAARNISWDSDAPNMVAFIESHRDEASGSPQPLGLNDQANTDSSSPGDDEGTGR